MKSVVALLMMLATGAAHGQMLKCVGKDGSVEYASQCPPGTRETQTGIRSAPSAPPEPTQQKSLAEREADFRKRQMEDAKAREKEEMKAADNRQRQAACEQSTLYLRNLQAGNRSASVDPKTGERVFLEDADRPAEIARAQRSVDAYCK